MSDYTPLSHEEMQGSMREITHGFFERGQASGKRIERERIIKLLEDACVEEPKCKKPCGCYAWEISLINGEQE